MYIERLFAEMSLPSDILVLKEKFDSAGAKLYVVGGAVRDFVVSIIYGKEFCPKDYDLVTDLHPEGVINLLGSVRAVGKSFGVVLAGDYEIATFREDYGYDGRRPERVVFSTIEKDAARRDLTINALYYDISARCVLDFHGGIRDLHENRVVFVGDAGARIREDKLRVLRFVRFHCRVSSSAVHKDTAAVIRRTVLRPEVSDERVRDEFVRGLLSCLSVRHFLSVLEDLGLLTQVFGGLRVTAACKEERDIFSLVAQILRYNEVGAVREGLTGLRWTAEEVTNIVFLVKLLTCTDYIELKRALRNVVLSASVLANYLDEFCSPSVRAMVLAPYPTVRGEEVMAQTGLTGKALGEEINRRELDNFRRIYEGQIG